MAPTWERTESGLLRCTAHNTTFGALETCKACSAPRAPDVIDLAADAPAPVTAPAGCATSEEHERQFCALATKCEELADGLALDGENANGSTVVKLLDAAIKARRAASALAKAREDDAFVADLERKRAAMTKRGRH